MDAAEVCKLEEEVSPTGGDREVADLGYDQKSWLFPGAGAIW